MVKTLNNMDYALFRILLKRELRRKAVRGWKKEDSTSKLANLWRIKVNR